MFVLCNISPLLRGSKRLSKCSLYNSCTLKSCIQDLPDTGCQMALRENGLLKLPLPHKHYMILLLPWSLVPYPQSFLHFTNAHLRLSVFCLGCVCVSHQHRKKEATLFPQVYLHSIIHELQMDMDKLHNLSLQLFNCGLTHSN